MVLQPPTNQLLTQLILESWLIYFLRRGFLWLGPKVARRTVFGIVADFLVNQSQVWTRSSTACCSGDSSEYWHSSPFRIACDKGRYHTCWNERAWDKTGNEKKSSLAILSVRQFRFCGPSHDPDEQTAVTAGFRHLVIQIERLAAPILPPGTASQSTAIDVEIDNLYSAYDAHSEISALLSDRADERLDDDGDLPVPADGMPVIADSRLAELRALSPAQFDFKKLVRLCEEINSAYGQKCYFATVMLTRWTERAARVWAEDIQRGDQQLYRRRQVIQGNYAPS